MLEAKQACRGGIGLEQHGTHGLVDRYTPGVDAAQLIQGFLHHRLKPLELLGQLLNVSRHLLLGPCLDAIQIQVFLFSLHHINF
jgi:hypothetical protein